MPELPEVETLKRELARAITGRQITEAVTPWTFTADLIGEKIIKISRRAKILIWELASGRHLLIHLKMTGQLIFKSGDKKEVIGGHPQENPFKYTRATITFADGSKLFFNDLRKFGWWKLLPRDQALASLAHHGVEPLSKDFTLAKFEAILKKHPKRKIKQILLDQTLIAGLGNIYVDESCFLAKVLPMRLAKSLTPVEAKNLHRAIISVLKLSIKMKGTSARNYIRANGTRGGFVPHLNVYGRQGEKCKRCKKGVIQKIKLNGRGTRFCNNCQK